MDIFLDMTGTITDMDSENFAILKLAEKIQKRFRIPMSAEEVLQKIEEYRKPRMDKRDVEYVPIRFLILEAVKSIAPEPLCANDSYWVLDEYANVHAKYVKLAPKAKEGLKKLRGLAEHMGVITDGDRPYTEKLLQALGIASLFDSITTAEDAGVGKPNPKIFQMALQNSVSEPRLYIGDSEKRDMFGAKRAGMLAIKIGKSTVHGDYTADNLVEAARIIEETLLRDNS
ncbi:MAG: HAD family hydrolase [Euryarchaeota archaeon]|nr:HAD family hydrolase [Euryarchaeota archaeon]